MELTQAGSRVASSGERQHFHFQGQSGQRLAAASDGDGTLRANFGAHQHWNNALEKRYSRDLGKRTGIELVRTSAARWNSRRAGLAFSTGRWTTLIQGL